MQILKIIGSSKDGLRHTEIAKALNIPKGSLSFLLADLLSEEFLSIDNDGRYRIGSQILILANNYLAGLDLIKLSEPVFKDLIEATNESAGLAVPKGLDMVIVFKKGAPQQLKLEFEIGEHFPMYASAAGKIVLAHYTEDELEQYLLTVNLISLTAKTVTDPNALRNELKNIRSENIAITSEELYEGRVGLAAPVFQKEGKVIAAIAQPIPRIRFNSDKERIIKKSLLAAAKNLSNKLGYDGL